MTILTLGTFFVTSDNAGEDFDCSLHEEALDGTVGYVVGNLDGHERIQKFLPALYSILRRNRDGPNIK